LQNHMQLKASGNTDIQIRLVG